MPTVEIDTVSRSKFGAGLVVQLVNGGPAKRLGSTDLNVLKEIKFSAWVKLAGVSVSGLCRPLVISVLCKYKLFVRLAGATILHCPNKSV